jgi:pimeloyl-ACP methyl ester carboxylesterase
MELAHRRWGNTSPPIPAKKLVLLHGMGGSGSLWRPIAAMLEDEFEILAPDQRGHGGSRIPELAGGRSRTGYSPTDYADDVAETMAATGFHPAVIVGHSMGARTACALAQLRPEWVSGLVLVDLGFDGLAGGGLGENLARFVRVLPDRFASRAEARAFMEQNCPDGSIAQYLMAVSVSLPEDAGGGIGFPFDHSALLRTIEQARGTTIRHWIEAAAERGIPVLALRGATSKVWTHEEFEAEVRHFSNPKWKGRVRLLEIEGAGHGLPFEKRPEFVAELRKFILKT